MWNYFRVGWPPENTVILLTDGGEWDVRVARWFTKDKGIIWEFMYFEEVHPKDKPPAIFWTYLPEIPKDT